MVLRVPWRKRRWHGQAAQPDAETHSAHVRAALPAGAAGQWCAVRASLDAEPPWWVKLEACDTARGQIVREVFLGRLYRERGRYWRGTLMHVPSNADDLGVLVIAAEAPGAHPDIAPLIDIRILTRAQAALALLAHGWRKLPAALSGGRLGLGGRLRTVLGQAPARSGEAPPYTVWRRLYDRWGSAERQALGAGIVQAPSIDAVIVGRPGPALDATLASLDAQWLKPARTTVFPHPAAWREGGAPWAMVLKPGEILAPNALSCFAYAAHSSPAAQGFFADIDEAGETPARPLFKPQADPWLLRSGLLTRGACLFRSTRLHAAAARDAEAWRQALAQALPAGSFHAVPFVLTHVPPWTQPASGAPPHAGAAALPFVSIIIPSAARSSHMLRCLRHLVRSTIYPAGFEILLAVSHADPTDRRQAATIEQAASMQPVRVLDLKLQGFNYARVNNLAVREATGALLLLLNDDVVPLSADWLQRMVESLGPASESADVVGARLLYGNGTVQHGGVIMGLAHLCEHAFRLTARADPGPHGLASVTRQVSAVTGACMLMKRCVYETVHGMDETYAIALNDVDFCLRAGQAGARIVFAPGVELTHYESLSLGRHYQGERARLEALEVRRLRERWTEVIRNDPHYSLSASLELGREFQPGFPPRLTALSWIDRECAAQG